MKWCVLVGECFHFVGVDDKIPLKIDEGDEGDEGEVGDPVNSDPEGSNLTGGDSCTA